MALGGLTTGLGFESPSYVQNQAFHKDAHSSIDRIVNPPLDIKLHRQRTSIPSSPHKSSGPIRKISTKTTSSFPTKAIPKSTSQLHQTTIHAACLNFPKRSATGTITSSHGPYTEKRVLMISAIRLELATDGPSFDDGHFRNGRNALGEASEAQEPQADEADSVKFSKPSKYSQISNPPSHPSLRKTTFHRISPLSSPRLSIMHLVRLREALVPCGHFFQIWHSFVNWYLLSISLLSCIDAIDFPFIGIIDSQFIDSPFHHLTSSSVHRF